jgi:hypothetical protein
MNTDTSNNKISNDIIISNNSDDLQDYQLLANDIINNKVIEISEDLIKLLPVILKKMDDSITAYYNINQNFPIYNKNEKSNPLKDYAYSIATKELGTDTSKWKREDIKEYELKLCIEIGYILLYKRRPELNNSIIWLNINLLKANYRDFQDETIENNELLKLLEFRNIMKIALQIMKGNKNKGHLINLCTRITEGCGKIIKYITGKHI